MSYLLHGQRLEDLDKEQLLQTVRRLLAEADALSSRIAAVNEIGVAINRTLDLKSILQVVARQAKWLLDFEHLSVCLQENGVWQVTRLFGKDVKEAIEQLDWLATENIGKSLKNRQPLLLREGSPSPFLSQYASQLIIPLSAEDTVIGTINFATTQPAVYTLDDMRIGYMLALELSSAIRNTRNFVELIRTRDELRERAAELEARNQELDAYSHTIAHDLKSPLNNIILRSDVLLQRFAPDLPSTALHFLTSMRNSGRQMSDMIDQLLLLAKLRHADHMVKPVRMRSVVAAALARFNYQMELNHIVHEVLPGMPNAMGEAQWLEEVFANLISNAIKYMGEENTAPRIIIRGMVHEGLARYEVQDNGIGISQEDQARLFEMFTRLHTIQADGLGLGLSIVHRIITRLNGVVGVNSTPNEGSTFWFLLPLADIKDEDVPLLDWEEDTRIPLDFSPVDTSTMPAATPDSSPSPESNSDSESPKPSSTGTATV